MVHLGHSLVPSCVLQGPGEGLPVPPSRKRSRVGSAGSTSTVTSVAPVAPLSPPSPPKPLPVIHSTAYLQKTNQLVVVPVPHGNVTSSSAASSSSSSKSGGASKTESVTPAVAAAQESLEDNAIIWALKKADDKLNEIEQQPSDVHVALYRFSTGPVGQATSQGIQAAAKATMAVTMEAAKVAAPVGKWALQQGFKAAVGLAAAAMTQQQQDGQQQQQQRPKSPIKGAKGTQKQTKGGR